MLCHGAWVGLSEYSPSTNSPSAHSTEGQSEMLVVLVQIGAAMEKRRKRKQKAAFYSIADPEMLERLLADGALLHSQPQLPSWADQLP